MLCTFRIAALPKRSPGECELILIWLDAMRCFLTRFIPTDACDLLIMRTYTLPAHQSSHHRVGNVARVKRECAVEIADYQRCVNAAAAAASFPTDSGSANDDDDGGMNACLPMLQRLNACHSRVFRQGGADQAEGSADP